MYACVHFFLTVATSHVPVRPLLGGFSRCGRLAQGKQERNCCLPLKPKYPLFPSCALFLLVSRILICWGRGKHGRHSEMFAFIDLRPSRELLTCSILVKAIQGRLEMGRVSLWTRNVPPLPWCSITAPGGSASVKPLSLSTSRWLPRECCS